MVVSVVTRGVSDDADSRDVEGSGTWLRISRSASGSFAFHAATDGVHWSLIRHFSLGTGPGDVVRIGFLAIADGRRLPGEFLPAALPA